MTYEWTLRQASNKIWCDEVKRTYLPSAELSRKTATISRCVKESKQFLCDFFRLSDMKLISAV
ncbi:MAG: hypothetical protein ACKESB_03735 [Candidatus Hodgkinia cicadicola]